MHEECTRQLNAVELRCAICDHGLILDGLVKAKVDDHHLDHDGQETFNHEFTMQEGVLRSHEFEVSVTIDVRLKIKPD